MLVEPPLWKMPCKGLEEQHGEVPGVLVWHALQYCVLLLLDTYGESRSLWVKFCEEKLVEMKPFEEAMAVDLLMVTVSSNACRQGLVNVAYSPWLMAAEKKPVEKRPGEEKPVEEKPVEEKSADEARAVDLLMVTVSSNAYREGLVNAFLSDSLWVKPVEVTHAGPSTNRSLLNACRRRLANASSVVILSSKVFCRSSANAS